MGLERGPLGLNHHPEQEHQRVIAVRLNEDHPPPRGTDHFFQYLPRTIHMMENVGLEGHIETFACKRKSRHVRLGENAAWILSKHVRAKVYAGDGSAAVPQVESEDSIST